EEDGVVAGDVGVLLGTALDLGADRPEPCGPLVDDRAGVRLQADVVEPDAVAVGLARRQRLADSDRGARAVEVEDRLAAPALDLRDPQPAERPEQVAVEGQAPHDGADDEIDVMDAAGPHHGRANRRKATSTMRLPVPRPPAEASSARRSHTARRRVTRR